MVNKTCTVSLYKPVFKAMLVEKSVETPIGNPRQLNLVGENATAHYFF